MISGLPNPYFGASINAATGAPSPSTQRTPPTTSTRARSCATVRGIEILIKASVASTIGTLSRKTQPHQ